MAVAAVADNARPRIPFGVTAFLALIASLNAARAGFFGRGGALGFAFSAMFAVVAALLWTVGSERSRAEWIVAHLLRRSTIGAVVGQLCIDAGFSPLVLLAIPLYWLSLPIVAVTMLIWIVMRAWALLTASRSQ